MLAKFDYKKFREERKKRITQTKLAELANTSVRYVRDLEKGKKKNPSANLMYQITAAMGLPMDSFIMEYDEQE